MLLCIKCDKASTEPDTTLPIPGNSGTISFHDVQLFSCTVNWSAATDNNTSQKDLQYMVVRSTALNITSVSDAEVNGNVVLEWTKNVTSVTDTALTSDTVYFYNVLVKDEAENVAAYAVASQSTDADLTDPVPGDSGAFSTTDISWTSFTLNWVEATDDISSSADLQYKVYRSTSPNITTIEDAETNGMVVQDWTAGITSVSVTGLSPNTWYYMNVTVKDEADNTAAYGMNTHSAMFEKIYWTDYGDNKIQRANLDGSNVEDLITNLNIPFGIALDIAGGKMYWTEFGTNKIRRANLDGSNVEDLFTSDLFDPNEIALDVAGGKMYWTNYSARNIQRANLDGSNVEDLIINLANCPFGIALDVAGGKMYWTIIDWTDIAADKIQRANLDGSNVEDLITTGLSCPHFIKLDVAGGKMYWTDPFTFTNKIQRANLDGSNVEIVIAAGIFPGGIALDIAGGKIYWADEMYGRIQLANLDGSNVEDLITNLARPIGIALMLRP
jgi:sugar lactone lactonase YvrE